VVKLFRIFLMFYSVVMSPSRSFSTR